MGKYITSGMIHSIKGSAGEYTFSSWKGMPTFSKRVRKRNKTTTEAEARIRKIFSELSRSWRDLSFAEWALWEDYAKRHNEVKNSDRSGLIWKIGARMSGFNAYISINTLLLGCGFKPIKKPVPGEVKKPPGVLTDLIDLGVYKGEIKFNLWLPYEYGMSCVAQVWAKMMDKDGYPYIMGIATLATYKNEVILPKIRLKEKGKLVEKSFNDIENCKLLLQMRTVAENGKSSTPSQIYRLEIRA